MRGEEFFHFNPRLLIHPSVIVSLLYFLAVKRDNGCDVIRRYGKSDEGFLKRCLATGATRLRTRASETAKS